MRAEAEFAPMWAVPPGRTISDLMQSRGIASARMAHSVDMSDEDFDSLLQGKCALTAHIAARLAADLGGSAGFWLSREEQYREQLAELADSVDPEGDECQAWFRSLPLRQMQEFGWVEPTRDKREKLRRCLEFFDVPNLDAWRRTYSDTKGAAAFRTSATFEEDEVATAAWLRRGELEAEKIECKKWSPALFESQLSKIRALTNIPSPSEFLPKLQQLCAEAGVAVVVVKAPKGCRASGATFFGGPDKAVLLLSFRYLSDDQFWFSFFHEAGHLVLHWDADLMILETSDGPMSPQEDEANKFATEQLIPVHLQARLPTASKSLKGIMRLARDAGVSYGIVVGQMQFRGLVSQKIYNNLKNRYKWNAV
ncbi:ImmA/IrrE family metallo-endopeptidase [Paraburkholderia sp. 31.1]|uniref:ImmA/IrrE family metallo-endopeptidase n=1 Tax=Paraburkholderia sp. 31.1 TaxID=2615205 RepID=UPI00165593AD|nr:ImmA/IrrE family metallo-endopeptidase [Paraburkholderia sp. 31.1]MBC8723468.1 ImmA/IrrE family metallo-endopeptidase [Paraburkholderia sp. 31.1]